MCKEQRSRHKHPHASKEVLNGPAASNEALKRPAASSEALKGPVASKTGQCIRAVTDMVASGTDLPKRFPKQISQSDSCG